MLPEKSEVSALGSSTLSGALLSRRPPTREDYVRLTANPPSLLVGQIPGGVFKQFQIQH